MQAQDPAQESEWKVRTNITTRAEAWTKSGVVTTVGIQIKSREDLMKIKAWDDDINGVKKIKPNLNH